MPALSAIAPSLLWRLKTRATLNGWKANRRLIADAEIQHNMVGESPLMRQVLSVRSEGCTDRFRCADQW